jgi:DNA-binding beta-propeller fold protein YncE
MRHARLLLAVGSLVAISMGQWLGEKLSLLDTLRIPAGYQSLAYNRHTHEVYLSGNASDSIFVIDADRCRVTGWIPVSHGIWAMCYDPMNDKLYCAYGHADSLVVLDGTSHGVLARVRVGDAPAVMCLDSTRDRLYIGNRNSASVSVFDCRADTVVRTIDLGGQEPDLMCLAPAAAKIFCADGRDSCIVAIDCDADTVVEAIRVGPKPNALCFSSATNRIYCTSSQESRRRVYGIDAMTDSVAWSMAVRSPVPLCCDQTGNRLFMPDFDTLKVVDCATGSTIVEAKLDVMVEGPSVATSVGYDPMDNRIYVVCDGAPWCSFGSITVWDGEAYKALKCYNGYECGVNATCITDARARFFFAGSREQEERVVVLDKGLHRVVMWTNSCSPAAVYADSTTGKLYCLGYPSQVIVVDQATNRVVSHVPVDDYPRVVCFNTVDRKVYVACSDCGPGALDILDGVGDTLLGAVDVGSAPTLLAYNPTEDVLYAGDTGSHDVAVISGKADSVIDRFQVDERPTGLAYDDAQHKLYAMGCDSTIMVIDPITHVVKSRIRIAAGLVPYALNSTGSRLYCGNDSLSWVYVIDCQRDTLECAVPLAGAPVAVCYDPPSDRFFSVSEGGKLSVVDCAQNSLVATTSVDAWCIYYDSPTDAIYCVGSEGMTVLDRKTLAVIRTFETGDYPTGIASVPAWPFVYVADEENSYLSLVHKASGPAEMAAQAAPDAQATVVRGRLDWTGTLAVMYDKCGRRVADVRHGTNDVSGLSPGVYFIRQNGVPRGTFARKVVVAK